MGEETTAINEVKTLSDGSVKISVEKYNELVEKIADQKGKIGDLSTKLTEARNRPPVVNRTTVIKTPEMSAREYRVWGGSLMGLGGAMFVVGLFVYNTGRTVHP